MSGLFPFLGLVFMFFVLMFIVKFTTAVINSAFSLTTICPACQAEIPAKAKVCMHCRTMLSQ